MWKELSSSVPFALKFMWVCLIGVPVFWVTVCAIKAAGLLSSETASWVQAFGAIISIWGAFQLANLQYVRDKNESIEAQAKHKAHTKNVMHRLSQDIYFHIEWLGSALLNDESHSGRMTRHEYMVRGLDLRWQHELAALQSLDVRDLDGAQTLLLADLKTACSFAMHLCSLFERSGSTDQNMPLLLKQYLHHQGSVKMAYIVLSPPGWEIS